MKCSPLASLPLSADSAHPVVMIGGRRLGGGERPMIVAELSGNHGGKLERALDIVRAAAEAGADAIKLQTYTPATLTIDSRRAEFYINDPTSVWHGRRLWELYEEAHTPWEWHEPLFAAARAAGLLCLSSAYDVSSVDFLARAGVDAIKIASFELVHLPLIHAAAATNLPLVLSTGMGTLEEIDRAVDAARAEGNTALVLLVCTSAYPSVEADAHLSRMSALRSRFDRPVGLSDHALSPYSAFAAAALGGAMIEKHVTLRRADGGPDAAFSLEPLELRELVKGTKAVWESLGNPTFGALPSERASLDERPSVRVARAMKRGDVFTTETLRIVRPASGLEPRHFASVVGRACARDLEVGEPLTWDLVARDDA